MSERSLSRMSPGCPLCVSRGRNCGHHPSLAQDVAKLKASAERFEASAQEMRDALCAAPDDNAKARLLFGLDAPTLIQRNHGEFDV